jgi:PKD repeat protein
VLINIALPKTSKARAGYGLLAALITICALLLAGGAAANAAVTCPNANPIVNENNCKGEGTEENQSAIENYSEDINGFTPQSSYNLGESVPLKLGTDEGSFPGTSVNISVYRIGYYGGKGARLIPGAGANNVKVNNSFECNPENTTTGEVSCSNWNVSYTIPGSSLPVSGIYEAVYTDVADGGIENYVIFPVRNDSRASEILYVLPDADYQAYNLWGCKSLYFDECGGANTIAGDPRAVAVSFDRPTAHGDNEDNHFFGPDYNTVFWLEQQGYDVTYTDDIQTDSNLPSLLNHKIDLVSGHSEYWSYNSFNNFKKARDAGVNIVSLSANTAYWQTRYENNHRTLVCYKTIQGTTSGNPGGTPNDPASIGPNGEARPELATTTRRDPGAPAGDPNAPAGGRIGPNEPENSLWGVMYVGDNDDNPFKLSIPAGNANGEFGGNRFWRNAEINPTQTTTMEEAFVGWEWDQIPTNPGYLAQEPAGVKQLTLTDVTNSGDSWLQDAGRARAATAPAGTPSNVSAVEYRAPSGALVFSTGTMEWSLAFDVQQPIDQATYNVIADMGVQPATPAEDITTESPSALKPPWPSFTATPSSILIGQSVSFNAAASKSPNGSITDYKWDFDNSGKFATDTGSSSTTTHTFTQPGSYRVLLKITDSKGQQETTERTVNVENTAKAQLSASMNPVGAGQADTLSGAGSSALNGTITDYKWDLDGNGTYETDTGSSPTVKKTFTSAGTATVGLQVTDSHGATATTTLPVRVVAQSVSRYTDSVTAVPSLLHYYRLDEPSGSTIADSAGTSNGNLTGATLGVEGAINGDSDTAANFPGDGDPFEGQPGSFGEVPMDLSSQHAITVEFWLKWEAYGNNDSLAMELTPNYNENTGGFIVDPDAPEFGGTFGVGLGSGGSRNSVFFARPSAKAWHHYAFVMNTEAPAESQITPYVDGQPISFQKESSGTGAGAFASSKLYLMSRAGTSLFGTGSLDELAIYGGPLSEATVQEQFNSNGPEQRPVASIASTPSLPHAGDTVALDGSGSHYASGSITKYEWDLNGDGTYETSTGSTPKTSTSFAKAGTYTVGLRVTDSDGATGTTTKQISVGSFPPVISLTASPNPVLTGQQVTLDAGGSTDQGAITDYKWDLDNSGTFATDTGSTPKTTATFQTAGVHTVGVRETDSQGLSSTKTIEVKVLEQGVSDYEDAVLDTPGLIDYYKLGEPSGPAIADSSGTNNGTISGGSFGQPGAVAEDPTTSVGFNGSSAYGSIPLDLSSTHVLTVEFWLKWNQYANDDSLAMEFTPNFNANSGGFLVDPNASQFGGTFGVAVGGTENRNSIFFARPSAGAWHHYVLVIDTTASSGQVITPYVDGQAVGFQQDSTGTGQGAFANSTLYLMSRGGNSLFGGGSLDQLALYNRTLTPGQVVQHYNSRGTTKPPKAAFTISQNPTRPGQSVTFNASGSSTPSGTITDYRWDLNGDGTYETDTGTSPTLTTTLANAGEYNIGLRVATSGGATATTSHPLTVGNLPPVVKASVTPNPASTGQNVTVDASATTDQGAITDYKWDLDGDGTYETDTGTTPKVTTSFATPGAHTIGVEATDDHGLSSHTTVTASVLESTPTSYLEAVQGNSSLSDYYKLDESKGPAIADSKGTSNGTITGGTFGLPGPIQRGTAVGFNGSSDSGAIPLNLSGTSKVTIEFWLKWSHYANDDALAMEFTPNFNANAGGFLVDPDAGEFGGTFGVSIGTPESRNSVFFTRPSAGAWHHYALVIDTTAPAATEITPYVDGQPVSYQKESSETGQGAFANSTLYLMSRAGSSLFGAGALDELAIYSQPLSATTVFTHYHSNDVNLSLVPSFTVSPAQPLAGQNVTLNAAGSTDSHGTITDYRWDIDGSGNYATDTGATPTLTGAAPAAGTYVVGLQTTDSEGLVARTTQVVTVTLAPPSKPVLTLSGASGNSFIAGTTAYTNPQSGKSGGFKVSASTSDSFSGVKNVTFPALSGFTGGGADTATPYETTYAWSGASATASGPQTVTATNNGGASSSSEFSVVPDTTAPGAGALTVNGTAATAAGSSSYNLTGGFPINTRTDYSEAQSPTQSGLLSSTLTLATASLANNTCGAFGAASTITGAPAQSEPSGCYRYTLTGIDNVGNQASVSSTVIVDNTAPTTPSLTFSGTSANVFLKTSTNALYFRPAAGGAFALTAASTDAQTGIREYKFSSLATNGFTETLSGGKMTYAFGATATQPATAPTIAAISNAGATSAGATYSLIADTAGPTGGALTVNNGVASAAGTTSFNTSGSFSISKRTDFSADAGSGFVSSTLTRQSATLGNGACGTFGAATTLTGNPNQTGLAAGCYRYTLTGLDRVGNAALLITTVEVDKTAPTATLSAPARANGPVALTFGGTDAGSGIDTTSGQLRRVSSTYTASSDSCGFFLFFANLGPEGASSPFSDSTVTSGKCYEYEYEVSDKAGNTTTSAAATVKVNTTKPSLTGITDTTAGTSAGKPQVNDVLTLTFSEPVEAASIPATVTLTYTRPASGSTTVAIGGIDGTAWSTGDSSVSAKYISATGASASATAKTTVSGSTVKLTITAINDPSNRFSSGGPATVSGTLASTIKDLFGNTASTSTFSFGNVRLF